MDEGIKEKTLMYVEAMKLRPGMYFLTNGMALGAMDALSLITGQAYGKTIYNEFRDNWPSTIDGDVNVQFLNDFDEKWIKDLCNSLIESINSVQ